MYKNCIFASCVSCHTWDLLYRYKWLMVKTVQLILYYMSTIKINPIDARIILNHREVSMKIYILQCIVGLRWSYRSYIYCLYVYWYICMYVYWKERDCPLSYLAKSGPKYCRLQIIMKGKRWLERKRFSKGCGPSDHGLEKLFRLAQNRNDIGQAIKNIFPW